MKGSNWRNRQRIKAARFTPESPPVARISRLNHHPSSSAPMSSPSRTCRHGHGQNHHLAGAIADVGMGSSGGSLEYLAAWNGRELRIAGRFAPTSKTLSGMPACYGQDAAIGAAMDLPECGSTTADTNAARNILMFSTAEEAGINTRGLRQELVRSRIRHQG